jgi:hypothetical protein
VIFGIRRRIFVAAGSGPAAEVRMPHERDQNRRASLFSGLLRYS